MLILGIIFFRVKINLNFAQNYKGKSFLKNQNFGA